MKPFIFTLLFIALSGAMPASIERRDDIAVDSDVDADVDVDGEVHHRGHRHHGLLDSLSLGGLVEYVLHVLGLYNYHDFEDNDDLLGFLVNNGDITDEEANQVEGIDILGLLHVGNGRGPVANTIDLGISALSDDKYVDEKRKNWSDILGLGSWVLDEESDPLVDDD
ncbi:hypothetical protein BGZ63DRAFT_434743 [Mariannaea sp. PMI_226]|nr:hypothetical protein BGZ63DRAFT_434743 [Mariannaea sp. PMI_226]